MAPVRRFNANTGQYEMQRFASECSVRRLATDYSEDADASSSEDTVHTELPLDGTPPGPTRYLYDSPVMETPSEVYRAIMLEGIREAIGDLMDEDDHALLRTVAKEEAATRLQKAWRKRVKVEKPQRKAFTTYCPPTPMKKRQLDGKYGFKVGDVIKHHGKFVKVIDLSIDTDDESEYAPI